MFKKIGTIVTVIVAVLFVGVLTVNAATKQDLLAKLTKSYTLSNGTTVSLTAAQKAEAERYINTNDVSDADAAYISGKVDEAVAIMNNAGVSSIDQLTTAQKNSLKTIVTDVSANTAIKVTLDGNKTISVYNLDGSLFSKVSASTIKNTSAE